MTPKRMFFVMLGAVVLLLSLASGGYYYTRQQLKEKSVSLSKLKADIDAIDDSVADAKKVLQQYDDLSFIDNIANDVLPPEKIQSDLVEQIYILANEAGVTVRTVTFTSPGGKPTSDPTLTQTVPLEGISGVYALTATLGYESNTYNNLVNFLKKLEGNRRKLQISSIVINPTRESIEGGGNATQVIGYQGSLELNVYIRP